MAVRAGTQFTPEQILEAGRRAEAEGRTEYALQFYRHLADQHRGTRESHYAVDALARLEAPQPLHNGNGNGAAGRRISIAPLDAPPRSALVELPPPPRDYRIARALARLATWCGGLAIVLGLAAAGAAVLAPGVLAKLPFIGPLFGTESVGASLVAGGIGMILGGQVVRALLDMALATRDMAAIMRAESEARGARPSDHDKRPRRRRGKPRK